MPSEKVNVPFNKPFIVGKELHYISQAVLSGHLAGDGRFTRRCEAWLQERTGAPRVLLTHSCTAALEMAALLCEIAPGDEVIMPSYTFVSTANAFVLRGATPVFVDVRRDTLNLDETLVEAAITDKTRAIVPVHYAGVGCAMDRLLEIADQRGLALIEDAAQGVDATYRGRHLGTFGALAAFSFHETKNYISGEGGALVINDEALIERSEILREKGTNRSAFFRGEVEKYTWVDIGSSYLPSEIVAAFLCAQLEAASTITRTRREVFERYQRALAPLAAEGLLRLPKIPEGCQHPAHLFYVLVEAADRDRLLEHFGDRGISAVFHYVPLHQSTMGLRYGRKSGSLATTEEIAARVVRLPCYFELTVEEQRQVVVALYEYFGKPPGSVPASF